MSDYVVSICRLDENGEVDGICKKCSIVQYPKLVPIEIDEYPEILHGKPYMSILIPEECKTILDNLWAFSAGGHHIGLKYLHGQKLTHAIDIIADAIHELHTEYKIWSNQIIFKTKKYLENLIEICHLAANCYVDEWNKYIDGHMAGFELVVKESLI